MPSLISNTISLIGGAAVGAAAMYLLDPDLGEDRRKDVGGAAADAVSSTHKAVRTTASGASDSAHSVANTIGKYAKTVAGQVSDHVGTATDAVTAAGKSAQKSVSSSVSDASDSAHTFASRIASYAKHLANELTGHVSDAADGVSDAATSAKKSVQSAHAQTQSKLADVIGALRSVGKGTATKAKATSDDWLDAASDATTKATSKVKAAGRNAVEPEHTGASVTGITLGSIGVLALGAGLMYYMDPERGRTRRALLSDKLYSLTRQSGDKARRYGHHLGNKAQGYVAQAKQVVPEQWVDKAKSALGQ